MPFDDDKIITPKVGLKPQTNKSIFDDKPKKPSKEDSERRAYEINDRLNSYPERSTELIPLFIKLLNSKELPINKDSIGLDIEREIIEKLMQLGMDMNADQYEAEGSGSIGLSILLMKCLLIQRDKINILDYNITQLKSEIKSLISSALDNKTEKK